MFIRSSFLSSNFYPGLVNPAYFSQSVDEPQGSDLLKEERSSLPLSNKRDEQVNFCWPPKQLEELIKQQIEQLQKCIENFKLEADLDAYCFLETWEHRLKGIDVSNKEELEKFIAWGHSFFEEELKEHPYFPLFFKNDFYHVLQRMQQAMAWEAVQETLEQSISKAYGNYILNPLFYLDTSCKIGQLGHTLLHLYQVNCPDHLRMQLQSVNKLYAYLVNNELLKEDEKHHLQALLEELEHIVRPLVHSSLAAKVKASANIPSYSALDKLKKALQLIFAAIGHFFFRYYSRNSEGISSYLSREHRDFTGNLLAREEVFRHEAMAKGNETPDLVNSYTHQIRTERETFIIHRSGSISDGYNGSTNLLTLKMQIMDQWKERIPADSFEEFYLRAMDDLKKHWNKRFYCDLQAIKKRQKVLEAQMLKLIANHVRAHIAEIVDSSYFSLPRLMRTIHMTQISLLNPLEEGRKQSRQDVSQFNQMWDMAAIFQDFDGKMIQFKAIDLPYMDDNMIYLPFSLLTYPKGEKLVTESDIAEPFNLACTFFNISVQGLTINQGAQREINAYALAHMQAQLVKLQTFITEHPESEWALKTSLSDLYQRFKEIEIKLERGDTGYAIAEAIALLQHDMQGMIGINCADGEDCTTYLIAKLAARHIDRQLDREERSYEEKEALKGKIRRDLMDINRGLASQIVYQSTGRKALRLQERKIMGLNEGEGFLGDIIHFSYSLLARVDRS